ncbi:hypothetical protein QE152_g27207 [Popillia japonica]|uniref:Uncharacterized protein n=1 Tax=Popillia japonica TaxID=7064 RepID=A0AAW1JV84_POPJA
MLETILGQDACEKFKLILRLDQITTEKYNQDVFKGLECLKQFTYDIDLIDNPQFEIRSARKIPHAIRAEVKKELEEMMKLGVIRPMTEPTR